MATSDTFSPITFTDYCRQRYRSLKDDFMMAYSTPRLAQKQNRIGDQIKTSLERKVEKLSADYVNITSRIVVQDDHRDGSYLLTVRDLSDCYTAFNDSSKAVVMQIRIDLKKKELSYSVGQDTKTFRPIKLDMFKEEPCGALKRYVVSQYELSKKDEDVQPVSKRA
jgi:hypothetical protein